MSRITRSKTLKNIHRCWHGREYVYYVARALSEILLMLKNTWNKLYTAYKPTLIGYPQFLVHLMSFEGTMLIPLIAYISKALRMDSFKNTKLYDVPVSVTSIFPPTQQSQLAVAQLCIAWQSKTICCQPAKMKLLYDNQVLLPEWEQVIWWLINRSLQSHPDAPSIIKW